MMTAAPCKNKRNMVDVDALLLLLSQAVARVELANKEGNSILAAWLPEAKAAVEDAKLAKPVHGFTVDELNQVKVALNEHAGYWQNMLSKTTDKELVAERLFIIRSTMSAQAKLE